MGKLVEPISATLKKRWVKALRSGKYHQGTGALRGISWEDHEEGFCCLGVLCDVMNPDGWSSPVHSWNSYGEEWDWKPKKAQPKEWRPYIEDCSELRFPFSRKRLSKLINMNDGGKTFDQIADYVDSW